jgi:hypothetical protein
MSPNQGNIASVKTNAIVHRPRQRGNLTSSFIDRYTIYIKCLGARGRSREMNHPLQSWHQDSDKGSTPNLLFDRCSIRCIVSGFSRIRDANVTQTANVLKGCRAKDCLINPSPSQPISPDLITTKVNECNGDFSPTEIALAPRSNDSEVLRNLDSDGTPVSGEPVAIFWLTFLRLGTESGDSVLRARPALKCLRREYHFNKRPQLFWSGSRLGGVAWLRLSLLSTDVPARSRRILRSVF